MVRYILVDLFLGIVSLLGLALMASAHNQVTIDAKVNAALLGLLCWEAVILAIWLMVRSKRRREALWKQSLPRVHEIIEPRSEDDTFDLRLLDEILTPGPQPPYTKPFDKR